MDYPSPLPAAFEGDPKLCRFVNGELRMQQRAISSLAHSRNLATARVAMQRNVGADNHGHRHLRLPLT
jgi:hypothetical protein